MKIINLAQGTQEWLNYRLDKIGGSDAPTVMEANEYSTPLKLWTGKVSRVIDTYQSVAMKHGHDTEPVARAIYEKERGLEMPSIVGEHEKHNFLSASLDGMNAKLGLEIKCPFGPKTHNIAMQGQIPAHHYWQLVHNMHVADLESMDYMSYFQGSHIIIRLERALKPEKELLKKEIEFWEMVQSKTAPEPSDKDYRIVTDPAIVMIAEKFKENKMTLDRIDAEQSELKKLLSTHTSGEPVLVGGVAIQVITRKGNVNYKAVPELQGLDLDKYRAKATTYVDVRLKRGKE